MFTLPDNAEIDKIKELLTPDELESVTRQTSRDYRRLREAYERVCDQNTKLQCLLNASTTKVQRKCEKIEALKCDNANKTRKTRKCKETLQDMLELLNSDTHECLHHHSDEDDEDC